MVIVAILPLSWDVTFHLTIKIETLFRRRALL